MDPERSLETILQDLRDAGAPLMPTFNQHHRQFLDRLRDASWVMASRLPDTPRTKIALERNGWVERRDTTAGIEYRITDRGLAALRMPR